MQISLFKKLNEYSPLNYKSLVKQLNFRKFNRGEIIFKEAEPCNFFYIALSGKLALLFPKPADQMAKEIKHIQSRSHLISKTKAMMRVQSAFALAKRDNALQLKNETSNTDHFSSQHSQHQPHKSTFKSKATSILRIQTALSSYKKDFTRNPVTPTPNLSYSRSPKIEVKPPLTTLLKGKELHTSFFSPPFTKNKQDENDRNAINPFSFNVTSENSNYNPTSGSPGFSSAGSKQSKGVLNIAGLEEEELGGYFFQEGVCKYILIKILKKAGITD